MNVWKYMGKINVKHRARTEYQKYLLYFEKLEMREKYILIFHISLIFFNLSKYTINISDILYMYMYNRATSEEDVTFEPSVRYSQSMQTLADFTRSHPVRYAMFDTVRTLSKYPRWRSHAMALDLRVSAAALRLRDTVGGRHRGRGTPPRDENKICLAALHEERIRWSRAAKISSPDPRCFARYAIDIYNIDAL